MRVLALDIGERRIGVAVSDPLGLFARPLCTVERASKADDFAAIGALVAEHAVERVVVGLPLTLRGEMGPQACQIDRYAEALAAALPVPVTLWDERYSTSEAADIIQQSHRKHRERGEIDAVAAAVILQGFLDSRTALEENV